jgi:hypothetical protein
MTEGPKHQDASQASLSAAKKQADVLIDTRRHPANLIERRATTEVSLPDELLRLLSSVGASLKATPGCVPLGQTRSSAKRVARSL